MRTLLLVISLCFLCLSVHETQAASQKFQYPEDSPAFEVSIPSSWTFEADEGGFSAAPKKDTTVSVAYYIAEGEEQVEPVSEDMHAYVDENWSNVKPVEGSADNTFTEKGVEFRVFNMMGDLKDDSAGYTKIYNIQIWKYSPASDYTAFAVFASTPLQDDLGKYITEFTAMLTGTKAIESAEE